MNESPDTSKGFKPRLIVKFNDDFDISYIDGAERSLSGADLKEWQELEQQYPGITLNRLYTVIREKEIQALVARAVDTDPDYRPPNFLSFFLVDVPEGFTPAPMVESFAQWSAVQTAYSDAEGFDPEVSPGNNSHFDKEGHLNPSDEGIDAEYAWPQAGGLGFPGADGAGIRLIDMELGWTLNHVDLVDQGINLLGVGGNRKESWSHGTRVLGVICAVDNHQGCIGIAPNIDSVDVVSYFNSTMADALITAIINLKFGDVLLIEAHLKPEGEVDFFPIEVLYDRYEQIRLATALGIVVVEAGGNGTRDLDLYTNPDGKKILNRSSCEFRDSGAIMVGASRKVVPHSRYIDTTPGGKEGSNYGSRIDCYAWGEGVVTTDSNTLGSTTEYSFDFKRTSAASAIIAGVAVAVQGVVEQNLSYRFSPRQMRRILSDTTSGTASASASDRIGVMPDLRAILQSDVLHLAPDLYLRDFVGDQGDPHGSAISASPDIILRPIPEPNPQVKFGEGSGTENNAQLGYEAVAGQDNHVYVRARNRGGSTASNVTVEVYWAPVATLLTPDLWNRLGSTQFASLPAGDVLTVAPAIAWPSSQIPAPGHYCFIGLIGHPLDPAPLAADFFDWANFRRFIRENNNVSWRNFNVVSNEPDSEINPGFVELPFLAPGAYDRDRSMQIRIVAKLPEGAQIFLDVPISMRATLHLKSPAVTHDPLSGLLRIPVNPHGEYTFREYRFKARSRSALKLLVCIPERHRARAYQVAAQQLYKGELMGQVTWRLESPSKQTSQVERNITG